MTDLAEKIQSDHIQDLTNALFLINGLHSKLSQESQLIATSVGQVNLAAKEFKDYLEILKRQAEKIQTTLQNESKIMGKMIAQEVSIHIAESASSELNKALSKLQMTSAAIELDLSNSSSNVRFFSRFTVILILLSTFLGGLIGGGMVHYLFPPINEQMGIRLHAGAMLSKAWPNLSQKERERIASLS
ncbi:hypothetical protein [Candidatus Odyssella acanthamoebae]|uniref:Uncharacterized protein n=1 Tax=Candidatus Odyssella acanthamoebae TaxID=91604 RepID=A0A077AUK3_9PROT|nr:hypothetical protein [Candidatus Paracaedibacter acanthamoebae]AIK95714.1 hypothetical protein ID47_01615 [Candidatus Paracaedibacter acanthamoebae]